jgi:hypothetical protein
MIPSEPDADNADVGNCVNDIFTVKTDARVGVGLGVYMFYLSIGAFICCLSLPRHNYKRG